MKRAGEESTPQKAARHENDEAPSRRDGEDTIEDAEMGEFEDPYGDDFESEDDDEIFEAGAEGLPDENDKIDEEDETEEQESKPRGPISGAKVYVPQHSELGENEVMEPDYSTYNMLHTVNTTWPSLSFDILHDSMGENRLLYPQSALVVTGTQAKKAKDNEISVHRFSQLCKTLVRDDSDDENSDDDDNVDTEPILETKSLKTNSTTNRIRAAPSTNNKEYLVASMAESGDVHIWDVSLHVQALERQKGAPPIIPKSANSPVYTVRTHKQSEGYAIDWCKLSSAGKLATGDIDGKIYVTERSESGWTTDATPFLGSQGSVEELQWSPTEATVFAAAGTDGHVRVWDTRQQQRKPALGVRVSNTDVNVMSWNAQAAHLLATGHDDGKWAVWDLRTFTKGEPVASFEFHKQPITSIEFHPQDESVVAVGSADNTVTLWDLSVEADDEEIAQQARDASGQLDNVPSQLLFVHWQPHIKELHWHRQQPGTLVSTGLEGFMLWNTISI